MRDFQRGMQISLKQQKEKKKKKKVNNWKVQGVTQSQATTNPFHDQEEKKDRNYWRV